MYNILETPSFGIIISVLFFSLGLFLNKKFKSPLLNPILIAIICIISTLLIFDIPYENYKIGADSINFFLGPITVLLAVPLYKQFDLLKKHFTSILIGITSGVLTSFLSITILTTLLQGDSIITNSLIPKSITTPMGISLSRNIGGIESITVVSIIITGITGAIIAPIVCKAFKNPVAKGIGIGTASHAIGTSRAIQMGEIEGAMSGLSIGISGLLTVIIIPLLTPLF
ncbi:MAG: LrgB family protein [Peptostreptococcaceae bacterium]